MINFLEFLESEGAKGIGTLKFEGNDRLVLEIDPNIGALYRTLIPKYKPVQRQMYPVHITVVRTGVETVDPQVWEEAKDKYEGKNVPFEYERDVKEGDIYYWLAAQSPELENIRQELGLTPHRPGYSDFHITIANKKPQP
jgi:hypothetical protein